MKTVTPSREADLWTALRYSIAIFGGVVMLFAVPKAVRCFFDDPLMASVVLFAAVGFCFAVRKMS